MVKLFPDPVFVIVNATALLVGVNDSVAGLNEDTDKVPHVKVFDPILIDPNPLPIDPDVSAPTPVNEDPVINEPREVPDTTAFPFN